MRRSKTPVAATPPTDEVQLLLDLIPEKNGFIFTGIPDQPHLRPQNLYDWTPEDPWVLTSEHTDLRYPNDQYPEDQSMTVTNRDGDELEYPFHEDAEGKRYFISGDLWYKHKDHVLGALGSVAADDPLGAARILYRWAQIYPSYVSTNEYPWHSQPVEPSSGPPFYWWGGMWYRWSVADGTNFRQLTEAFALVDQTTAFDELSTEVGEDVRETIIRDMFEPSADFIRTFVTLYHNMEYHNFRGLISMGKALDDPSYIHESVEWALEYARSTYLFDGFFQENTLSYHVQSTSGLIVVLDEVEGWTDPEGYESPRSGTRFVDLNLIDEVSVLAAAMRIPNLLVYPNGHYFPTQDTWASSSAGQPDFDTRHLLLPASGIARVVRGEGGGDGSYGIPYEFLGLEIVDQSVEYREFPESATLQLEAETAGEHITFTFDVAGADTYDLDLTPFRAPSYGIYQVTIDGEEVAEVDFYHTGSGPSDTETIANLTLPEGRHEISFHNNGKADASSNYKLGLIRFALLDEAEQERRDDGQTGEDTRSQLYLTFNPKYGHHHRDPLNLALYSHDQELLPDIGYTHTFYRQWTMSTMGHNTVVVDAEDVSVSDEARDGGNLEVFAPVGDSIQVMRANQQVGYPQTSEYRREPWFIGFPDSDRGYVLDLFRVSGGERHEYTLHGDANHDASFDTNIELSPYGPYLLPEGVEVEEPETENDTGSAEGHYYGYIYVREVQRGAVTDGQYRLTLQTTDDEGEDLSRLAITGLVNAGPSELFIGEAPSLRATRVHGSSMDTNTEAVKYWMPKMVLRREGDDLTSQFISTIEPYGADEEPLIESVERLEPDQSGPGDLAVRVTYGDTTDIIVSSTEPDEPLVVGDITLHGALGFIRLQGDQVQSMHLVGGSLLAKGSTELSADGPVSGSITQVERRGDGADRDAFHTDAPVPQSLEGHTILVTHPTGKTHGYPIKAVTSGSGQTVIELDDMDPGFVINDEGSSEQVFYPFTTWTEDHTFRIENTATLNG